MGEPLDKKIHVTIYLKVILHTLIGNTMNIQYIIGFSDSRMVKIHTLKT